MVLKNCVKALILGIAFGIILMLSIITVSAYSDAENKNQQAEIYVAYEVNDNGETFGSSAKASAYEAWPDLTAAVGDNGVSGYIRTSEAMGKEPSSPEEAIMIQQERINNGDTKRIISLFDKDGVTIIDTFTISYDDATIAELSN